MTSTCRAAPRTRASASAPKGSDYIKGSLHSVRRHADRRRPDLRPHPELDGVAAERRLLLDELLDVPRAQRRRLLPVLGRHRVRARAVRDHQAPARVQPLARRSDQRLPDHQRGRRRPRLGLLRRRQARRRDRLQRDLLQGAERRGLPRGRARQDVSERRGRGDVAGRLGAVEEPGRRPQAAHQRGAVRPRSAASTSSPTATTATRRATPSRRTPTPRRSCGTSRRRARAAGS